MVSKQYIMMSSSIAGARETMSYSPFSRIVWYNISVNGFEIIVRLTLHADCMWCNLVASLVALSARTLGGSCSPVAENNWAWMSASTAAKSTNPAATLTLVSIALSWRTMTYNTGSPGKSNGIGGFEQIISDVRIVGIRPLVNAKPISKVKTCQKSILCLSDSRSTFESGRRWNPRSRHILDAALMARHASRIRPLRTQNDPKSARARHISVSCGVLSPTLSNPVMAFTVRRLRKCWTVSAVTLNAG